MTEGPQGLQPLPKVRVVLSDGSADAGAMFTRAFERGTLVPVAPNQTAADLDTTLTAED